MIAPLSSVSFTPQGGSYSSLDDERTRDLDSEQSRPHKKEEVEKQSLSNPQELDRDEKAQVEKLKRRDAEVRAHEQAHMAAAGNLAISGPNFVYQTGPDGRQYAIGGDVQIDTSPGRTPEETLRKAQQIRAAALAPADPSAQDLKVAAAAASMETEAASKTSQQSEKDSSGPISFPSTPDQTSASQITTIRQLVAIEPLPAEQTRRNN